MADKDLSVKLKIEGDASSAKSAVETTDKSLQGLSSSGKQATTSTESLNQAFAKLGVRSARQIETDLLEVNQTLMVLARRSDVTGAEFDRAFAAAQVRIKQLRAELDGASGDVAQVGKRAEGMLGMLTSLGKGFVGVELARQFVSVNVELENIERTFKVISGSSEQAAKELEYVRDVADRLGLPILAVGKAYADLSAATKGTAVEGDATRAVFEAVSRSMSMAGKSSADIEGALLALSQMASKGTVAMEELRGQLGERLPGALNAVADGFGITTAELIKLVESGQLTTEELFPALTAGLNKLYGATGSMSSQTETLTQKWAHLKNSVDSWFKMIGDSGAMTVFRGGLDALEVGAVRLTASVESAAGKFKVLFKATDDSNGNVKKFVDLVKTGFSEVEKEAQDKLVKVAMHNSVMAATLDESGKRALEAAKSQAQNAASTEKGGAAAAGATPKWIALKTAFNAKDDAAEKASKQAINHSEAVKAEAEAGLALANALGSEAEKRQAKVNASRMEAAALAEVANHRREELNLARQQLAALEKEVDARNGGTDAQKKQLAELKKTIEAREAEADKAAGQARSAAIVAAQADVEAQAHENNSARVLELKASYEAAAVSLEILRAQKTAGVDVTAQLEEAEIKVGQAATLYRDALADQQREIQQNLSLKQSQISVDQAGVRLAIEQQRTILEVARARGDERSAAAATLEIKKLEIKLAELTAQAKKAEADAILQSVQVRRDELRATGDLTAAKEAELKAQEAGAKVKQVEAQIAGETAKRMRELSEAYLQAGDGAGKLGTQSRDAAGDIDRIGDSAGRASDALDRLRRRQTAGSGNTSFGGKELSFDQMKAFGMSDSEIQNVISNRTTSDEEKAAGIVKRGSVTENIDHKQLAAEKGIYGDAADTFSKLLDQEMNKQMALLKDYTKSQNMMSVERYRTVFDGYFNRAVDNAAQETKKQQRQEKAQKQKTTVEINIPGNKSREIEVADASQANALSDILKQLGSTASRSRML